MIWRIYRSRECSFVISMQLLRYHIPSFCMKTDLVLASSLLTSLELIKIPPTDCQRTLVLVHALAEVVDVCLTSSGLAIAAGLD